MSLNSLNRDLTRTEYGYHLDEQTKINHLFYVGDLKINGTNDNQLTGLVNTVKMVSDDLKMGLGLDSVPKQHSREKRKHLQKGYS